MEVRVENVSWYSRWMLHPHIPLLMLELSNMGYMIGRVKPHIGGYDVAFIEPPNVIAIRGFTSVRYDFNTRFLGVEGPVPGDVVSVFSEIEGVLDKIGCSPSGGTMYYEATVKARASHKKILSREIEVKEILGFNLVSMPTQLVMENGDPNKDYWFHLEIRPVWTTWPREEIYSDIVVVYRASRNKEELRRFITNVEQILTIILERITK